MISSRSAVHSSRLMGGDGRNRLCYDKDNPTPKRWRLRTEVRSWRGNTFGSGRGYASPERKRVFILGLCGTRRTRRRQVPAGNEDLDLVAAEHDLIVRKARGRNGLTLAVREPDFALETVGAGRHDDFGIEINQREAGERARSGCAEPVHSKNVKRRLR